MQISRRHLLQALLPVIAGCAGLARRRAESVEVPTESWMEAQRLTSLRRLLQNISPAMPVDKRIETRFIAPDRTDVANMAAHGSNAMIAFDGAYFRQRIVAAHGAIAAAAPAGPDQPDYYFHWLRDSSLIMRAVVDNVEANSPVSPDVARKLTIDYINFTRQIQRVAAPIGLGEPRFTMDGSLDVLRWSRPQNDGPALRILTLMRLRDMNIPDDVRADLDDAIRADVDFLADAWQQPSFDLWEEYIGHDYHARASQYAALRFASTWASARGENSLLARCGVAADGLRVALDSHWLADKNYYGFFVGPTTHWSGAPHQKPGDNLDTAVIIGVVHAALDEGPHSVLDDRVLATANAIEKFFETSLPINHRREAYEGVLVGRYANDTYFGDNAYVMISLEFAQFYFMAARAVSRAPSLDITPLNLEFLSRAQRAVGAASSYQLGRSLTSSQRATVSRGLMKKGDAILRHIHRLASGGEFARAVRWKDRCTERRARICRGVTPLS